jgi:hypothetical protein
MVAMKRFTAAAIIPMTIAVTAGGEHAEMAVKCYSRRIKWNYELD